MQLSTCPIDPEEFALFPGMLFSYSFPLTPNDEDESAIQHIPACRMEELEIALKEMTNLRKANEDGIVVERIELIKISFKETSLCFFNQACSERSFDSLWHTAILQLLSNE